MCCKLSFLRVVDGVDRDTHQSHNAVSGYRRRGESREEEESGYICGRGQHIHVFVLPGICISKLQGTMFI